jgi:signal transduction histidine kinase
VRRLHSTARRYWPDLLIVVAAIEAAVEVTLRDDAVDLPVAVAAPALALVVLVLLARRSSPFAAPLSLWLLAAPLSFLDGRLIVDAPAVYLAGLASSFMLGALRDERRARAGLGVVLLGITILMLNAPERDVADGVGVAAVFAIAWLAGYAQRQRAVQAEAAELRAAHAEHEREAAARLAVAEERARIARELHDVVAHAVSVMVLQVGAVRHRFPDARTEDADALRSVERTGRTALGEMRRLLGAMRSEGEEPELGPQPGLGRLDALLDDVRRAGLPVRLDVRGEPIALPDAIDLSAYRIVQEGLTNALKHAHASQAEVVLGYDAEELRIEVRDDGEGAAAGDGLGHGLVGIGERVKIYGGEMTAATAEGGGFVLSTRLPLIGYGA